LISFGLPELAFSDLADSSEVPSKATFKRGATIAQSRFPRSGQSSFQGSEFEPGQPNGVGKTGRSERNAPPCWSILEE
jgi:hypothetical protein